MCHDGEVKGPHVPITLLLHTSFPIAKDYCSCNCVDLFFFFWEKNRRVVGSCDRKSHTLF
jgi:hypothetical protein